MKVLVGEHDTSDSVADKRDVSKIRTHPRYKDETADYDFAILFLSVPLTFSSSIRPVCLPASTQSLYTGQVATVTGWGLTSSGGSPASTLQEAEVTIISNEECNDHYPGKIERSSIIMSYIILKSMRNYYAKALCKPNSLYFSTMFVCEAYL